MIQSLSDLAGKRVAYTSPTSSLGNQAPRALFLEEGVEPDDDYEVVFADSHDPSVLGVVSGIVGTGGIGVIPAGDHRHLRLADGRHHTLQHRDPGAAGRGADRVTEKPSAVAICDARL